jgi:hypothetical protein
MSPRPTVRAGLRRWLAGALLLTVVAATTAACGGGGVPPNDWAANVCGTLGPWRARIADLNGQAQQRLAAAKTPEQTRTELLALLTGAQAATDQARASVAAAGDPDVDGGADAAHRFVASLETARDAYGHAVTAVSAIPTTDPAYYDKVAAVLTTLSTEYQRSTLDPAALGSPDLQAAFAGQAKCQ